MIPKIIHYCWFGKNLLPGQAKKCIASWKKYMPDYQIKEWNEDNYDINKYIYTREAYDEKKYAFVSDVVRLDVLYEYGGVYMDTDVEAIQSLDTFLCLHGFSGFDDDSIPTGTMAAEKGNGWIRDQLDYYIDRHFDKNSHITNVDIITDMSLKKHGLVLNGKKQELSYGMVMFPKDYFCAKSAATGKVSVTENTYTIHHFAGSWLSSREKRHARIVKMISRIIGQNATQKLLNTLKRK